MDQEEQIKFRQGEPSRFNNMEVELNLDKYVSFVLKGNPYVLLLPIDKKSSQVIDIHPANCWLLMSAPTGHSYKRAVHNMADFMGLSIDHPITINLGDVEIVSEPNAQVREMLKEVIHGKDTDNGKSKSILEIWAERREQGNA